MDEVLEKRFAVHQKMMQVLLTQSAKGVDDILAGNFYNEHHFLAIYSFAEKKDDLLSRQHFCTCAMINSWQVKKFNNRLLDYGIANSCHAVLSDCAPVINEYAGLSYRGDGKNYPDMDVMVAEGEMPIFNRCIQQIIKKDWEGLKVNLDIMKRITLPNSDPIMRLDFEFYTALIERDQNKAMAVINELLTPANHEARNISTLFNKYISQPATGYLKLAWLNGMEIEIKHPLVPMDLIHLKPLKDFATPYSFLKS